MNPIEGCVCSGFPRCNRSGWIRCEGRKKWLQQEADRLGYASWTDISTKTSKPRRGAKKAEVPR